MSGVRCPLPQVRTAATLLTAVGLLAAWNTAPAAPPEIPVGLDAATLLQLAELDDAELQRALAGDLPAESRAEPDDADLEALFLLADDTEAEAVHGPSATAPHSTTPARAPAARPHRRTYP